MDEISDAFKGGFDVKMDRNILKREVINKTKNELLNVLINNQLNYGEARIIIDEFKRELEEYSKIMI